MMKKHILNKIAIYKINLKKISKLLILALNIYIQFISISFAQSVGSDNFNFVGKFIEVTAILLRVKIIK